ncbi:hypothetical protein B9Z19DRAFT_1126637 [Tuber borchii]|uniref:Uncharacterized protein n=1 Tax=Tuber borchii TaxID=42251 RepID=A0A2T6ZT20_TUBBO|nr:hypothetical protein B9Z19DRAFT_1126637 [Tuber borchii]
MASHLSTAKIASLYDHFPWRYRIPGALDMQSQSSSTTAFYAIPSVHRQKDVSIPPLSMELQRLLKGGFICRILGALGMPSPNPFMTSFYSIPSVQSQKGAFIQKLPMALQSSLEEESVW